MAAIAVLMLFGADSLYFSKVRALRIGDSVNESVIRNGRLGKILRTNGLLEVDSSSAQLATSDMCAEDKYISSLREANTVRLRLKLYSNKEQTLKLAIIFSEQGKDIREEFTVAVTPNKYFYKLHFHGISDLPFNVEIASDELDSELLISDLHIDGQYGRTLSLMQDGIPISGQVNVNAFPQKHPSTALLEGVPVAAATRFLYQKIGRLPKDLLESPPLGIKRKGYCTFSAPASSENGNTRSDSKQDIFKIALEIDDEYLEGSRGILNNLSARGRGSEVPAKISFIDSGESFTQAVGLRFHGGQYRRKENALKGYRIYARPQYGKDTLGLKSPFSHSASTTKTLVLRSNQAYGTRPGSYGNVKQGFNPYNHSLALDIGREIGAVVMKSRLVDLEINSEKQDLYLALEHLSQKTVANSLGHDNFYLYAYKKTDIDQATKDVIKKINRTIWRSKGEEALQELRKHFDLDNVINSIILRSYVGDNDFCQGAELIDKEKNEHDRFQVTTIDWDLDHAFIHFDGNSYTATIDPNLNAFYILRHRRHSRCFRRRVYSHVYAQSANFRQLIRTRLELLLENELSEDNLNKLIVKYQRIDQQYYDGKHKMIFVELKNFFKERPAILLDKLTRTESRHIDGWAPELD